MSESLVKLLGEKLLSKDGEVSTADALKGKKAIAIYFSAHWCPPCRGFTPKLAEWYKKDLSKKGLEVVFVSSDKDQGAFDGYFGEQPWLALPFSDRERKNQLSKKFKVNGIPSLIILDKDGNLITEDGRSAVSRDPTGEKLPWVPPTFHELIGNEFVKADGTKVTFDDLKGKTLGLYFSAHWCPPCRGFTPQLAEYYKKYLKDKNMEIIFVSSDQDEKAFNEYLAEMPWCALPFAKREEKEQLSGKFGVRGIPTFVIVDKNGKTITTDGRARVSGDKEASEFPWYPKPVNNLADGPGEINDLPSLIVFMENCSDEVKKETRAKLERIGKDHWEESKKKSTDPEMAFFFVEKEDGIGGQLRQMTKLSLEEKMEKPQFLLLDIPDNGGFYTAKADMELESFAKDYKSLERQQLS